MHSLALAGVCWSKRVPCEASDGGDGGPYETFDRPSGTSIVDTGLVNGATYYYTVFPAAYTVAAQMQVGKVPIRFK